MGDDVSDWPLNARAATSAFLVLAGPFVAISIPFFASELLRPEVEGAYLGGSICLLAAATWSVWLMGFRIRCDDRFFVYRDGFYRTRRVPRSTIRACKTVSIRWRNLPRKIEVSRLKISVEGSTKDIMINPKVFSRKDLSRLAKMLRPD